MELKEPDRWLNIDCPSTEEGCYLRCLEKFGIMLPQETLHTIRTELKIGHFVSSRQIEGMLKYIGTPLQVIIHNCKKDGTFANTHDSTKIPKIKPKDCATMHLGHIHNHFFLIYAPQGLQELKELHDYDFEITLTKEEHYLKQLNTELPVVVKLQEYTGRHKLWMNKTVEEYPFTDRWINRKIASYKRQDEKKNRICDITIDDFKEILKQKKCYYCHHIVVRSNCTLDRLKNSYMGHTKNNCVLSCRECNVKKRDKENEIGHWDIETVPDFCPDLISPVHDEPKIIDILKDFISPSHFTYCASITFRDTDALEKKEYDKLKTIKFYHTEKKECFAQLEDWILKKDLEIDDVVNEKLGQWFQIYKEQHPKMSEVTLEKEKKRRRSQLLECHRLILYAYNGSRYENQFIYKSKRLLFDYVLEKYGIIEIMLKGSRIVFRDSMRMLGGGSLEKQCKDYKIPEKYAKHQFPHKFMTRNTFFYKGKPPEDKYWENGMPDKYKDPNYVYDLQKESAEYNAYDTISDCIILYEFSKSIKNVTGLDILDFTTISALAYNYAMENVPPEMVYLPTNRAIDEFIRLSFQGGRCFRQKGSIHFQLLWDVSGPS